MKDLVPSAESIWIFAGTKRLLNPLTSMLLLDTNVVSEPTKPVPDPNVLNWIDNQSVETLYLPTTALAEVLEGVERMPPGSKRSLLLALISDLVHKMIGPRVLSFDRAAAERYAALVTDARRRGQQVGFADGQIASIAAVRGFTVVTRDVDPFLALGVPVIDPWATNAKELHPSIVRN